MIAGDVAQELRKKSSGERQKYIKYSMKCGRNLVRLCLSLLIIVAIYLIAFRAILVGTLLTTSANARLSD